MNNKPEALWDGQSEPVKSLRLPKSPPNQLLEQVRSKTENGKQKTEHSEQTEAPVVNSRLSADAPVFVPRNAAVQVPPGSSIQDRLKRHRVSENAQQESAANADCLEHFVGTPDDVRLNHLIDTLTKDPGQFSDLLEIIMDTLCPYFEDILVLSRVAQLLVEKAIDYPSFRYSAARLCCCIEQHCAEFRAALHLTCQKNLSQHSNKSGLLLFVAELYTQLHHENIYGNYLIEAYKHLLNEGGNDNVKCICQALKLTGYSLERYNKKALDEVFEQLDNVKSSVTGTALSLINAVVALRGSQWGHNSPTNVSASAELENSYCSNDTPHTVFYNADGLALTSEETEFLAANMNSAEEYLTDYSDPDELCDPEPEMDEEIQAAFKVFVKLSKR